MDNNNPTGTGSFTFNGNELISSDGSIAENTHLTNKQYVDDKVKSNTDSINTINNTIIPRINNQIAAIGNNVININNNKLSLSGGKMTDTLKDADGNDTIAQVRNIMIGTGDPSSDTSIVIPEGAIYF